MHEIVATQCTLSETRRSLPMTKYQFTVPMLLLCSYSGTRSTDSPAERRNTRSYGPSQLLNMMTPIQCTHKSCHNERLYFVVFRLCLGMLVVFNPCRTRNLDNILSHVPSSWSLCSSARHCRRSCSYSIEGRWFSYKSLYP